MQLHALAVDQLVYVDRTVVFTDVASLGGSTYIMTGNDDKLSALDPFLTFDVSTNVVVYVAHDDLINPKPTWMSSFSDTGENLVTTTPTTLSLYAREFPAGAVSLGGNEASIFSGNMYSVVITSAPTAAPTPASNPNSRGHCHRRFRQCHSQLDVRQQSVFARCVFRDVQSACFPGQPDGYQL